MKQALLAILLSASGLALADPPMSVNDIPTTEREFVDGVSGIDKSRIVEQFGEPSKVNDVKTNKGRTVASIWYYHYLNTNADGDYYQTTELDFIDDKVVMVVFLNNDGEDRPDVGVDSNDDTGPAMNNMSPSEPKI